MSKLWLTFLSIVPFVLGAMAKGRGGGGAIDDGWDVPATFKAEMAFQIIWSIVIFVLFVIILRRLRFVPPGRYTRAPYIMLAIVAGTLSISRLLSAILLRISSVQSDTSFTLIRHLGFFNKFLWSIGYAFEPGVCLWLIHLRGRLTITTEGKSVNPWVSQLWKRIIDWLLVASTFIISISMIAILANLWARYDAHQLSSNEMMDNLRANDYLGVTTTALGLFLAVDVIVSFITIKVSQKRAHFTDPMTTRLVAAVVPFVLIGFLELLVSTIIRYLHTFTESGFYVWNLLNVIIDGMCRIGIIGGLLSTMTIPNVPWVPGATTSAVPLPVGEGIGYKLQKS